MHLIYFTSDDSVTWASKLHFPITDISGWPPGEKICHSRPEALAHLHKSSRSSQHEKLKNLRACVHSLCGWLYILFPNMQRKHLIKHTTNTLRWTIHHSKQTTSGFSPVCLAQESEPTKLSSWVSLYPCSLKFLFLSDTSGTWCCLLLFFTCFVILFCSPQV